MTNVEEVREETMSARPQRAITDMKLDIVVIPVPDVDGAREFYSRLGWRLEADFASAGDACVIQFTPPASGCSVNFGESGTAESS